MDLRELVRKKQHDHQLSKRIEFEKDIQEIEKLLAEKVQKDPQPTPLPAPPHTPFTPLPPLSPPLNAQISDSQTPPTTNFINDTQESAQPQKSELPKTASDLPDIPGNYYNPFFSQQPPDYSAGQFQPLYYVPYQTQYTPPAPSQSIPENQGLPRRRRAFNQTPSAYYQYPAQGYWGQSNMSWPPYSYTPSDLPSSTPSDLSTSPSPPYDTPLSAANPPSNKNEIPSPLSPETTTPNFSTQINSSENAPPQKEPSELQQNPNYSKLAENTSPQEQLYPEPQQKHPNYPKPTYPKPNYSNYPKPTNTKPTYTKPSPRIRFNAPINANKPPPSEPPKYKP